MISVKANNFNIIFSSLILCSVRLHYTCVDHFRRLEQNNYVGKTPWVRIMQKRKKRGRLKGMEMVANFQYSISTNML